ncbi:MAG TPA: EamA family transporter, partial [Candidatus Eisenbacteria bacterium]|nr:EamA family transporter [Candidatus Eisenbacteria bacterium]
DAIGDTAANFVRSVPLAIAAGALLWVLARAAGRAATPHVSSAGLLLATGSGVLASGAGYAAWFAALRSLRALQAAALQLTVPVIAAAGGILFLSERISMRLVVSAALILGGVGMALGGRAARTRVVSRSPGSTKPLMG